jgi:DNA-directed RNA polymerase subunit RPC12/RpoP
MARASRRRRIPTTLRCNKCGHEYQGLARFVSIETADRGTLQWMATDNATMGHRCSQCGSESIVVVKPLTPPEA